MGCSTFPEAELKGEPTLEELFGDPIVRLVMRRDGVEEGQMREALDGVRSAYRSLLEIQ